MTAMKVMIIGLDCAEPSLVLERWRDELPTLGGLMERGALRAADLGRAADHRAGVVVHDGEPHAGRPRHLRLPQPRRPLATTGSSSRTATHVKAPRLWDLATRNGKPSIVLGVPGTYPPRPLNGVMVTCFLTPSIESQYTYPPLLAREVEQVVGEYLFDCTNFRTDDKDDLLRQVYEMTDRRFGSPTTSCARSRGSSS